MTEKERSVQKEESQDPADDINNQIGNLLMLNERAKEEYAKKKR